MVIKRVNLREAKLTPQLFTSYHCLYGGNPNLVGALTFIFKGSFWRGSKYKEGPIQHKPWPSQTIADYEDSFILSRQYKSWCHLSILVHKKKMEGQQLRRGVDEIAFLTNFPEKMCSEPKSQFFCFGHLNKLKIIQG